ncbi:MAG: antitoxin [Candidatus Korobacteraceae bacterium]|jgi:antitoxin VapB
MAKATIKTAKLFRRGNSQAVWLPQEFRFPGDRARIRRMGDRVVLEPVIVSVKEWLADLQRHPLSEDFLADGRNQPAPRRRLLKGNWHQK